MNSLIVKSCSNGEAPNDCCPFYAESSVSCNILGRWVTEEFAPDKKPDDCPLREGQITVELEDDESDKDSDILTGAANLATDLISDLLD